MLFLILLFTLQAEAAPPPFRVRLHDDLGTLDWNNGEVNGEIVYQLMDGLFRADAKGQPRANVARSFSWNKDKTLLKLKLGKSRWSDGKEVCAQHFVDSWARLRSRAFASPYAHYAASFESFAAKGCRTLEIHFRRPSPEAPAILANSVFFPVRLDYLLNHPQAFNEGVGLPVNGPFQVAEWKRNTMVALEQNSKHVGEKPKLDRVEFRFIPEDSTAKTMFELKELDWMKEIPQLLRTPELEKSPEFRLFPSLIVYYFGLNAGEAPVLADESVRHLLSDALDRSEIPKILGKECRGTNSWLVPELLPNWKPLERQLDPKARERLEVAIKKDGLSLKLYTYSKTSHKLLAEWAQGQWEKKLGVRIPVVVEESKVYWKEVNLKPLPIFFGGVTAPFGHPRAFLQDFLLGSSANWTSWRSATFDSAVAAEKYAGAEEILEHDGFVIPLYQRDTVALVQQKWKGFFINPLGQAFLAEVR